jgi:hypothetical protein
MICAMSASGEIDKPIYLQNKNNLAGFLSFSAEL